jgi:two-component system, LuxR family, response regulator FixJ
MGEVSTARRLVVIVVDDDGDVLQSLRFAFEVEGFEVRTFPNGEALLRHPALADEGCLVLDYRLDGIDGLTLLDHLREQGNRRPAILITTPDAMISARAACAGVAIIEKPLLCDTLVTEVRRLIDQART